MTRLRLCTSLSLLFMLAINLPGLAAERMVLMEKFSNAA